MNAVLSPCGTYRYALWRNLQRQLPPLVDEQGGTVLFVMLNPSTADHVEDDPTIRRCLGFARREGYARLAVANLFALRSTKPERIATHPEPVGPLNDQWLSELALEAEMVIVAWGASRYASPERVGHVKALLAEAGRPVCCLGLTSSWEPRHPLMVPRDWPLAEFDLDDMAFEGGVAGPGAPPGPREGDRFAPALIDRFALDATTRREL